MERQQRKSWERKTGDKEEARRAKEGEWCYNPANDEYWWSGENDPPVYDDYVDQRDLTEEEKQRIEDGDERWCEASRQE